MAISRQRLLHTAMIHFWSLADGLEAQMIFQLNTYAGQRADLNHIYITEKVTNNEQKVHAIKCSISNSTI